jgi:hypothetical protein
MSIKHQFVVSCDQNPIPNRCDQRLTIQALPSVPMIELERYLAEQDWATLEISPKHKAHYCPWHRPVR